MSIGTIQSFTTMVRILGLVVALSLMTSGCGNDAADTSTLADAEADEQTDLESDGGTTTSDATSCGDGALDPGEACDPAIAIGQVGACPTGCAEESGSCSRLEFQGSPESCTARCVTTEVTDAIDGDGCCPAGAYSAIDADCAPAVGDPCTDEDAACPTAVAGWTFCADQSRWTDFAGGYCSAYCRSDAECPEGGHCSVAYSNGQAICFESCEDDDDCREGYGCYDYLGDGKLACAPAGTGTGGPGAACEGPQDCGGGRQGRCDLRSNFVDGYCYTTGCLSDTDCGEGAHCAFRDPQFGGYCIGSCTTVTDCRSGYGCVDVDGDQTLECYPSGVGSGTTGDPCEVVGDCQGGTSAICYSQERTAWYEGACTMTCRSDADCGDSDTHCSFVGSISAGVGICSVTCTSDDDCRSVGYLCLDDDADGVAECIGGSTGTSPVGSSCEGYWDCVGRENAGCFSERSGFDGGYCTIACGDGRGTCPDGSSCISLDDPATAQDEGSHCLDVCNTANDCRDGYRCYTNVPTTSGGVANVCSP